MSTPVLIVDNVGKCYRQYSTELQRFAGWFGIPIRPQAEQWVLRNVSFKVASGEAVGIVGQNGAGKSTLLKIITGTTRPNTGSVNAFGRISALLELGLGFNPELTGRENATHAAGLMGIRADEIPGVIAAVEEFAEIGDYFDQPIRTYSSGMQMRVAFSVATAIRPEILIVDEALSVGDAYFVHKCFKRIMEFREAGTTLLIVSHDAGAIQAMCDRAILFDGGRLAKDGEPQEVMDYYNALIADKENNMVRLSDKGGKVATESGSGEAVFRSVQLLDAHGDEVEYVSVGDLVTLRMKVDVLQPIDRLVVGYMVKDRLGQPVFGTNTHHTGQALDHVEAGASLTVDAHFPVNLGAGTYSVSIALSSTETHLVKNFQWRDLALVFNVANTRHDTFIGVAWIKPEITFQQDLGARQ